MNNRNSVLFLLIVTYGFVITGRGHKTSTISRKLPKHGKEWQYGENWTAIGFDECGKTHQSPIRLTTGTAVINESLEITLENYNTPINTAFIENNGHTVQLGFSDQLGVSVIGSATNNERYMFAQLHWHWGSHDDVGSEHTIDGLRGPMEMHLVHYNQKYGSFEDAVDKPDGLLVLGVLYKITRRPNYFLSCIINLVKDVPKYEDKALLIETFTLRSLLPRRLNPFFQYSGSLTSPPCYQTVNWIVFQTPIRISDSQEREFRKCRGEHKNHKTGKMKRLSNNYRPTQPINDRVVQISL